MAEPRTIDNLGVDSSTRYALDQQFREEKLFKDLGGIATQIGIDVTLPSFASELDLLLHSSPTQTIWAHFFPPRHFLERKGRIFAYLLIPSLGSEEKKEAQMQKIRAQLDQIVLTVNPEAAPWEQSIERAEEEKELKKLIALFDRLIQLNAFLVDINSRRLQYQKG